MPGDALTEAVAAVATFLAGEYHEATEYDREVAAGVLDAVPPSVLARLVIERGGMEQVAAVCARDRCQHVNHWHGRDDDACKRCACPGFVPVYRLTGEAPDA